MDSIASRISIMTSTFLLCGAAALWIASIQFGI